MTLTRDWRSSVAIALAILAGLAMFVWGNQRQVHAQTLAEQILCQVDVVGDAGDGQTGIFPMFEQDCNDGGGTVIDWCPGIPGTQSESDLPCDDGQPTDEPQCSDGVDNDGDGKTDWDVPGGAGDPGCSTPTDDNESDDPSNPPSGGGGDKAACEDGVDNDGDSKVDMDDPGCSSPQDTNETDEGGGSNNPPSGGSGDNSGGSSGGSSGGGGFKKATTTGEVLGAEVEDCSQFLTDFLRAGQLNDSVQVARLQYVLKEMEGMDVPLTGRYDALTVAAVHAFQTKYAADILTPWGITKSTGYTYLTTRKKINEIYCAGKKEFPLSDSDQLLIERVRTGAPVSAAPTTPTAPASVQAPAPNSIAAPAAAAIEAIKKPTAPAPQAKGWFGRLIDWLLRR
ncbi:MAG: hypothetical protein AAB964_01520 [Patescibacteria group bacterium]